VWELAGRFGWELYGADFLFEIRDSGMATAVHEKELVVFILFIDSRERVRRPPSISVTRRMRTTRRTKRGTDLMKEF
jgi:hypothetical protein